jgi:hypothetical protein
MPLRDDSTMGDGRWAIADCRLPIADCRLPIADCRLPIADCRSAIADRRGFMIRSDWRRSLIVNRGSSFRLSRAIVPARR